MSTSFEERAVVRNARWANVVVMLAEEAKRSLWDSRGCSC